MIAANSKKNIAILSNHLAGNGRSLKLADDISQRLSEMKIPNQIFKDQWPADLEMFSDVFISGGDGTLNYFVNHYRQCKIPISLFNGGTGNDFHWLLYGNKSTEEQLMHVLQAVPKPVDTGRCNDKIFMNGLGIGFEGAVAGALTGKKKLPGKTSFYFEIIRQIFSYKSSTYKISIDGKIAEGRKLIVSICNGKRAGGGFFIAPESDPADGLLDVVLIDALHSFKRLRYLPVIEKGKHLHLPIVNYSRAKKIIIESDRPIFSHLDGEFYTANKIEAEILPDQFLFRY